MSLDNQPPVVDLKELVKCFSSAESTVHALQGVTFSLTANESLAIVGPSGSGKSTLLNLIVGLDQPTSGTVTLAGTPLGGMDEDTLAGLRAKFVGFVFQDFHLLPGLSALENVMLPLEILGRGSFSERFHQAQELLDHVGLSSRFHHFPYQLSGGEQQRVAIARACIHRPALLLADEPTGNLDLETGHLISDLLFDLQKESGSAILLATHDRELAARANRIIHLRGGQIVETKLC